MSLAYYTIKNILRKNGKVNTPADDFRVIDSYAIYDDNSSKKADERKLQYLCYELETIDPDTGETLHFFKALKFARVIRLPKAAKQSTSLMDMHQQILSAVYSEGYNLVTVIANIISPVPLGLLFLYGVQGIASDIETAKKQADADFIGFTRAMQGTYRVLEMQIINAQETEWLREKMYNMNYMTVVRGIPKASESGENIGNKGIGGKNLNPNSQGTLEEFIAGMVDYEYVIQVLSTPVKMSTLKEWHLQTTKHMTDWNSQLQGTSAISLGISMPMMMVANQSTSQGWSKGYTDADSITTASGESFSTGYGESVSESLSRSFSESMGLSQSSSLSESVSVSQSTSQSISQSLSESVSQSISQSLSQSTSQSVSESISNNQSFGQSFGQSSGQSMGQSFGQSFNQSTGQSTGMSSGISQGMSVGQNSNTTMGQSFGQSVNVGQNTSESMNVSSGANVNFSNSQNVSQGESYTDGSSMNVGQSQTVSGSHSVGENSSIGTNTNVGMSQTESAGVSQSQSSGISNNYGNNFSTSENHSINQGFSQNQSFGQNSNLGYSQNTNVGIGASSSGSSGMNASDTTGLGAFGISTSGSFGASIGRNLGSNTNIGWGNGTSESFGTSMNQGYGESSGESFGIGSSQGTSVSVGSNSSIGSGTTQTESVGINNSFGSSQSHGASETYSESQSAGSSESFGVSQSHTENQTVSNGMSSGWGQSVSHGQSVSTGQSFSQGMNVGQNLSQSVGTSSSESMSLSNSSSTTASQSQGTSVSQSGSMNLSETVSAGTNSGVSTGMSSGVSSSVGNSVSNGVSNSVSNSVTNGVSNSVSNGRTEGVTQGTTQGSSYTKGTSEGNTQGYSQSQNISQGTTNSKSIGESTSVSTGSSGAHVSGMSSSMGFGPSISYNKSFQWMDQTVKDILELLEFQNERLKKSLRGEGAFYTYVYIACPSRDALSAAQAVAKSTWQNEQAMVNPLQILRLSNEEQSHLLYHFSAFSSDVTRENVAGILQYRYCTVLTPSEFVAYTHLPRISEGGIFADVNDIPIFAVKSEMKGDIYMGTILSAERYSLTNGYMTPYDFRIDESELMHGFFTGASRSGKTVAAMRFVTELSKVRRKSTGKRLRIVCMDPKRDWRTLARFVDPDRFKFHSLGNASFRPVYINPFKIPKGVVPQTWIDGVIDIYCRAYGLLERGKQMMGETIYMLYEQAGVFNVDMENPNWSSIVQELSAEVTFPRVYKQMEQIKAQLEDPKNPKGRAGNDTRDAYARLLDRLQCFSRPFTIETKLFGSEKGISIDELIGADDVTILESSGLEKTFKNFIFGIITSGFYQFAKAHEGGYLAKDQYETVLVIEEANEVLIGNDAAGSGGGSSMGMTLSGQSEFEEILDQSAGYGLFIIAITQKISDMPKSVVANSGLVFAGRLKIPDDITTVVRSVAREERYDDRELVKLFPRMATGMFVCQRSRTFDIKDAEPYLVQIARLPAVSPSNLEIDEILSKQEAKLHACEDISA